MALEHVLSAMRTLILDTETIPEEATIRQATYQRWFPELSAHETEDLAKIHPDKLRIYTSTIFTGEAKIIRNHFKMCVGVLKNAWPTVYGEAFRPASFTKQVHSLRPWKSYETQAFVNAVRDVLCYDLPELLEHTPALADLALLEALVVEIKRHPDPPQKIEGLPLEDLEQLTVEELLSCQVVLPESNRYVSFSYNVVSTFQRFHAGKGDPVVPETAQTTFAIGSRGKSHAALWSNVPQSVYTVLAQRKPILLSELAECFVAASDQPEEELFQVFIQHLRVLLERRALVLTPPPSRTS